MSMKINDSKFYVIAGLGGGMLCTDDLLVITGLTLVTSMRVE